MKKALQRVAKFILIVLVGFFVIREFRKHGFSPIQIWNYLLHADGYFYSSLGIFTLFLMLQAYIWVRLINRPTYHLGALRGMVIYINSQFVKYMPGGGVLNFIGRFYMTSKEGVSAARQIMTMFYEGLLLLLAASVFSLYLIVQLGWIPWYFLIVAVILIGLLYRYYRSSNLWLEKVVHRFVKKFRDYDLNLPRKDFFQAWGYFIFSHLVMGLSYMLLLRSFHVDNVGLLYATGTFALAWILGILSPIPGGLGVREFVMILLLKNLGVDALLATQISVITRIWNVLGELIFFMIINLIERVRKLGKGGAHE
jgi:uncharacterized membrane protein YbhN (UPF0104 family)